MNFLSIVKTKEYWMGLKGLATVLFICVLCFICIYCYTLSLDKPNEKGDSAGLANGIFSALAFAGVIYAIFLQRNELELQREELSETRKEFIKENETLKRQRFENTFFNMLQLQQQITDNIIFSHRAGGLNNGLVELRGRDVFYQVFERVKHWTSENQPCQGMRGLLEEDGLKGYEENFTASYFDHYFRHLYRIIKFVDQSDLIEEENRYQYTSMVRALLSRYELVWLYYNSLSAYGVEKFKPLIEKYALLKNLRDELLVKTSNMDEDYASSAYTHSASFGNVISE